MVYRALAFLLVLVVVTAGGATDAGIARAQMPPPTNLDEDGSGDVSVGDTLTYEITATNTGAVLLTNVIVSDVLSGDRTTCPTLASGGTCVLFVSYTVTPADVAAGSVSTTATATSDQTGPVALEAPATLPVPQPALAVDKPAPANADEDGSGDVTEGDTLTYTVTATNIGSANLTNVVVSDASITPVGGTAPCALVTPGGTCTLVGTHVVTAADEAAGRVDNVATAVSVQTGPVQDSESVAVLPAPPEPTPTATPVPAPVASIEISAMGTLDTGADETPTAGDAIAFSFRVTNTGEAALVDVVVESPAAGVTGCAIGALAPGAVDETACSGSYVLTQADIDAGEVVVEAVVTAVAPGDGQTQDQSTTAVGVAQHEITTFVEVERVAAIESGGTGTLALGADGIATPGDVFTYSLRVTNTGNVALFNVVAPRAGDGGCQIGTLAPGEVHTACSGTYRLTQADIDAGEVAIPVAVTAEGPTGPVAGVTAEGGSVRIAQAPAMSVERQLAANADEDGSAGVSQGDSLTFEVTARNAGNMTLTNVLVGEDLTGDRNACPMVAPGGTCILSLNHTVTQANADAGAVPNLAFATSDQTGEVRPQTGTVDEVAAARIDVPSNFLNGFPGWSGVSMDAAVAATNLSLALLALLTLLVATTVFNSTLEENAADIDAALKRISGSPQVAPALAALGWMSADEAGGASKLLTMIKPMVIILVTALIYALLEPSFGFNNETLVVVVALIAGIAVATFLYEGGQVLWASARYDTPAAMRIYPLAILIAIGCVALTRVTDLHPGIIFGFVTAAALFPRGEMARDANGKIIAVPLFLLMLVSFAAFLLIDPLQDFAAEHSGVWAALPETIAVAVFVGGAQSALLILIPVRFNDGQKIWVWNKAVWFALAVPAAFAFFHVIVNDDDYGELVNNTNAMTLVVICLVVLAISTATWLFFRLREREAAV